MIYGTFAVWMLLILLTGVGLYRLWGRRVGGAVVDWLLLLATLTGELAYSLGRLITGRPAYGGLISPRDVANDPCRYAISGKGGFLVALLSSLLTLAVTVVLVGLLTHWLGRDVVQSVVTCEIIARLDATCLPKELPTTWDGLWDVIEYQIVLVRRLVKGLAALDWTHWQVPVYVYLSAIFAVRLGPVRHDQRAMLVTAGALLGILALIGTAYPQMSDHLEGLWYLLTYLWSLLLTLLMATLAIFALVSLVNLLRQKPPRASKE